jgi:hypothetical protein
MGGKIAAEVTGTLSRGTEGVPRFVLSSIRQEQHDKEDVRIVRNINLM